jgi:hypothetical protein
VSDLCYYCGSRVGVSSQVCPRCRCEQQKKEITDLQARLAAAEAQADHVSFENEVDTQNLEQRLTRQTEALSRANATIEEQQARLAAAEARNGTLKQRLRDQTNQTQITAQQKHDEVLATIQRLGAMPDGIDPQGHPIEQIVGTVIAGLQARLAMVAAERDEARDLAQRLFTDDPTDFAGMNVLDFISQWPWLRDPFKEDET